MWNHDPERTLLELALLLLALAVAVQVGVWLKTTNCPHRPTTCRILAGATHKRSAKTYPIYCGSFFVRFCGLVLVTGEDLRAARLLDGGT